ncbi:MAG: patatin-like phospholipase family protein [Pseudomonadota bacterium]
MAEPTSETPKTRRILSIDGGGVRGIVAAVLLDALDDARRARGATRPLADCFDIIAGTSTGAIVAAGLAAAGENGAASRRSPAELRRIYRERAREIFPLRFWGRLPVVGRLRQFFGPFYSPAPLQNVLNQELGDAEFQNLPRNLLICAYSIDPREAAFFRGGPDFACHAVCEEFAFMRIADAVCGSAAAPTFFPPKRVESHVSGKGKTLIDGGVFANDPAQVALAEGLRLFPDDDFEVVSIGTGRIVTPYPLRAARGWGFWEWVSPVGRFRTPLLSVMADGQARAVHAQLEKLLGGAYHRFDYDLESGYGSLALDDASPANMRRLEEGALKMVDAMRDDLDRVAAIIG